MFVIPREGYTIIDPDRGDTLPAAGRNVPDGNPYWTRRLRDGDVTKGTAPEPPPDPEARKKKPARDFAQHTEA